MVYLLVYSNSFGNREDIARYFSSCQYVEHWRYDLPNSFYLVSDNSASEIGEYLRNHFHDSRYFLTEISSNRQGWLPKDTWKFFHDNE